MFMYLILFSCQIQAGLRSREAFLEAAGQHAKDGKHADAALCYVAGNDSAKAADICLAQLKGNPEL